LVSEILKSPIGEDDDYAEEFANTEARLMTRAEGGVRPAGRRRF